MPALTLVIHSVENSSVVEAQKEAFQAAAGDSLDADFGATLHAASKRESSKPATTNAVRERVAVPEGETWAATKPGAHYAHIISGPRKGLYINLTHGDRRGETFSIEHRDGKKLHVYKESGTAVEIKPSADANDITDAAKRMKHHPADRPHKGERWEPVEGHNNYADIIGGTRNGLYVNISGGIRDGMAFQIVKKGDKVFHVYGTGKEKQMIQVEPRDDDKKASHSTKGTHSQAVTGGTTASDSSADAGTSTTATAASNGTGGTAAPSSD